MQALPYIVVTREGVGKVYEVCVFTSIISVSEFPFWQLYWSAFEKCVFSKSYYFYKSSSLLRLRRYPQIKSLEDNGAFCVFLQGLLDEQ